MARTEKERKEGKERKGKAAVLGFAAFFAQGSSRQLYFILKILSTFLTGRYPTRKPEAGRKK